MAQRIFFLSISADIYTYVEAGGHLRTRRRNNAAARGGRRKGPNGARPCLRAGTAPLSAVLPERIQGTENLRVRKRIEASKGPSWPATVDGARSTSSATSVGRGETLEQDAVLVERPKDVVLPAPWKER